MAGWTRGRGLTEIYGLLTFHFVQQTFLLLHYANNAGAKLRARGLWAYNVGVYIRSSPFKEGYYSNFTCRELNQPTQDTRVLIAKAIEGLEIIYKPNIGYKKSGLMLGELTHTGEVAQYDLLSEKDECEGQGARPPEFLLTAIDRLNQRYGRHTVMIGGMPQTTTRWQGNRNHTSQRFTTRWTELLKV